MITWKERNIRRLRGCDGYEKYDYLINEWIPGQPDAEELMNLFIECGFHASAFLLIVKFGWANAIRKAKEMNIVNEWHDLPDNYFEETEKKAQGGEGR